MTIYERGVPEVAVMIAGIHLLSLGWIRCPQCLTLLAILHAYHSDVFVLFSVVFPFLDNGRLDCFGG